MSEMKSETMGQAVGAAVGGGVGGRREMRIAGNARHSGLEWKDSRGRAETMTREQVDRLLAEPWLAEMVGEIRGGNEARKDQLPFLCPHYWMFRENKRKQEAIMPETFTYMTCVDIDDKAVVERAIARALALNGEEGGEWQGQVLRIDRSARNKAHIWIRIPKGKTIEEAQKMFCEEMGDDALGEIKSDASVYTPERMIFITDRSQEVYRSEEWLMMLDEEEIEERREAYLARGLDVDGRAFSVDSGQLTGDSYDYTAGGNAAGGNAAGGNAAGGNAAGGNLAGGSAASKGNHNCQLSPVNYHLPPADERTRYIFRACMQEAGLESEYFVVEGKRHPTVKAILSVGVPQLMTKEEFCGALAEVMPEHWSDKNIQELVDSFYTKYFDPNQKMTQFQRNVFAKSMRMERKAGQSHNAYGNPSGFGQSGQGFGQSESGEGLSDLSRMFASPMPPEIPKVLPRLVKAALSCTPQYYKATVAQAIFPPLATYPKQLGFRYIDNQVRELRINCLVVAGTGSGKDSCTNKPLKHILADIDERDETSRHILKNYNEDYTTKPDNKQKPKRPEDMVIQNLLDDVTKAALVQRMDGAKGAPLYVKLNELELWDKIEGCSGRNNRFSTMKINDDEGNRFGTERASAQSSQACGCLHLNWNANTTEPQAIRYFRQVLTDGPISRLCLATIPEQEIGADIEVYGDYDEKYDEALKPFIDNLKAATGTIDCQQARRLARRLKDEVADFARLSQDRVLDNLSHRALVAAFRKACLLYAANGMKWERAIEDFCRWSLFYDLYIKMRLWGDLIRHADDDLPTSKRGPRNLLEMLPTEFTLEDAKKARQKMNMSNEGKEAILMIRTWMNRGYCIQNTEYSFRKATPEELEAFKKRKAGKKN